jgi:hypothetical protein
MFTLEGPHIVMSRTDAQNRLHFHFNLFHFNLLFKIKVSLNSFFHGIGFVLNKCKFDDVFLKVKQYKILDALISLEEM